MGRAVSFAAAIGLLLSACAFAQSEFYQVDRVEAQPLTAHALRVAEALSFIGSSLRAEDETKLKALAGEAPGEATSKAIQDILDPYCLLLVHINPEMRVKVHRGPSEANLIQGGWSAFLVKVHNEAGTRAVLQPESPNALPRLHRSTGAPNPKPENALTPGEVANRFLELSLYQRRPMVPELSGLPVEYAIFEVYTSDKGQREATLGFNAGQGTQDIGFRNEVSILFHCRPAVDVTLRIKDVDGAPAMASFIISDNVQRFPDKPEDYRVRAAMSVPTGAIETMGKPLVSLYPLPSRRMAATDPYPDFFFQPQIYRADGETVTLPPGTFDIVYTRGPEYLPQLKTVTIPDDIEETEISFELKRWIHLAEMGYYSADHHVHGGGCSHYESPEAGVTPEAMMRQSLGEDLNIACVLTWGPCWYFQKQFFEGGVHPLSQPEYLMRYDVEVSGFPSSHAGHLCLLRLKEDDYPGTTLIEEWPSWTLPVLKWGQDQGGVVGYSHSGWGLEPMEKTPDLPNYVMAKFDGIGANEYIVTTVHGACDFISAGDTPPQWELNIWYHTLNCGFTSRISGETDFPCIYDEKVGLARSYAPVKGELNFDAFCDLIKLGANYVSDGRSHILDFKVNDVTMGTGDSTVRLASAGKVAVSAKVAAHLPPVGDPSLLPVNKELNASPYWHLEKARVGETRRVPVELIVNGYPVAMKEIEADGSVQDIAFDYEVPYSSWVALRILPSSHTNPIFVNVGDKPIRASKRSAEWCRKAVDRCWDMKVGQIREADRDAAKAAYDVARAAYDQIIAEAVAD
ncbi:MAG: hypothetical protein AMXMBFR84_01500 [Candidatus Hydrogenedentota bacterium]